MRAFISHSSKDKGFIESMVSLLKPGTYELDSETFDAGLVNSTAITVALRRCDMFCLFLSTDSITSRYVDFETLLGFELLAKGKIERFIAICLDQTAFEQASNQVRFFNIVRNSISVESAARLIQGQLVAAASTVAATHPFIPREAPMRELESQVTDPGKPNIKALFISGNFGSGRRAFIQKFYGNQFPHVGRIFPTVKISDFVGLEELYRKIILSLKPSMNSRELISRATAFSIADDAEKRRQIADLINSALSAREAVWFIDNGGLLTDSGAFQTEISSILDLLKDHPHPPLAMIAPRMIPKRLRRPAEDVAYVALKSWDREDSTRLARRLFKDRELTSAQLSDIVSLADGHPYNFYRIVEELEERGVDAFLANPAEFHNWKHRQSSEYINKTVINDSDALILGVLKLVPSLDFQSIVESLPLDADEASDALLRLANLHIVEFTGDLFMVSPPLRIAVERDKRIDMPEDARIEALRVIAQTLSIKIDEGSARLELVDTAVLSAIESGFTGGVIASALLMPSHYVWLAQKNYDQKRYPECIRLAKEGLKGSNRLSIGGLVAACRFMCLAAARIGESDTFDEGIRHLEAVTDDDWARSNIAHLRGFNARLQGKLPSAEDFYPESYRLSPGNISTAREIAAVCLARGNLSDAESFAREAHAHGSRNAYVNDILIAILAKKLGRNAMNDAEVRDSIEILRQVDEETGRSFYTTRKAELEFLWGDTRLARNLIEDAIKKTPKIFETHRIYAEILLKEGNKTKAEQEINWMRDKVNSRDPRERRTNYRQYLVACAHYMTEIGKFADAKKVYEDSSIFTGDERRAGIREIEIVQAYRDAKR